MNASRSLTEVKVRYSQTEHEALAIVWACERFHTYLYGIKFHLVTKLTQAIAIFVLQAVETPCPH